MQSSGVNVYMGGPSAYVFISQLLRLRKYFKIKQLTTVTAALSSN